jgi:hypothetical protein
MESAPLPIRSLLTGERGHYAPAAGHGPKPFVRAMETFASSPGLSSGDEWDALIRFTSFRPVSRSWEGHDYLVSVAG